ncbi:unnamed protein product [Victoria cruziana]
MARSPCCSKEGLNRGAWTSEEDQILSEYVKAHGEGRWRTLPKRAGLKRCGKSCRLRWLNYLRPDIKRGNISDDEEELIIRMHKLLGNRWSLIAGRLPGRTDNEIKNYWNTNLVKKLQKNQAPISTRKRASPGKSKKPAKPPTGKRQKGEGKPRERRAVRATAMRRMDTMDAPPADAPACGSTEEQESAESIPAVQDPCQETALLPKALEEDLMRDAAAAGGLEIWDLLDDELLKFPEEEGIAVNINDDNNDHKEFGEPNYFDQAMLEELMGLDTSTRPSLPPDMEQLCVLLDPEAGWL